MQPGSTPGANRAKTAWIKHWHHCHRCAPIPLALLDSRGRWICENNALKRILKNAPVSKKGLNWFELLAFEDRDLTLKRFMGYLESKQPFEMLLKLNPAVIPQAESLRWHIHVWPLNHMFWTASVLPEGQLSPMSAHLRHPVPDMSTSAAAPPRFMTNHPDPLWLHNHIMEINRDYEHRWRSLAENAPDTILHVNRDLTIAFINHGRLRPQMKLEDVIGRSVFEFVCPEYRDLVLQDYKRVMVDGETLVHEVEILNDLGGRCWLQSQMAPLYKDGKIIGATVVCRDITALKLAEDRLRQMQDQLHHLARVASAGELTAALAHELNQPLLAIANYLQGCLLRLQAHKVQDWLIPVLQSTLFETKRASDVIKRLRQFLQRQIRQHEELSPADVLEVAIKLAEPIITRVGLSVKSQVMENIPNIYGDRVALIQVFFNLLLNAMEASKDMPEKHPIRTCVSIEGEGVEFIIADAGQGIPPDLAMQVFEPFVTTKRDGLGMGLAIAKTIVQAHQGKIWHTPSGCGRGTEFRVWLPKSADCASRSIESLRCYQREPDS